MLDHYAFRYLPRWVFDCWIRFLIELGSQILYVVLYEIPFPLVWLFSQLPLSLYGYPFRVESEKNPKTSSSMRCSLSLTPPLKTPSTQVVNFVPLLWGATFDHPLYWIAEVSAPNKPVCFVSLNVALQRMRQRSHDWWHQVAQGSRRFANRFHLCLCTVENEVYTTCSNASFLSCNNETKKNHFKSFSTYSMASNLYNQSPQKNLCCSTFLNRSLIIVAIFASFWLAKMSRKRSDY